MVTRARAGCYCSLFSRRDERNSDQKVENRPATFTTVCPQDGFAGAGAGGEVLRRHAARPATKVAAADAKLLMVLA